MEDEARVNLEAIYVPSEDIVVKDIRGESVIIPVRKGTVDLEGDFFKLNEAAKVILDKLDGRKTLKEITQELNLEYDAALDWIEKGTLELAGELLKRGILVSAKRA